MSYRPDLSSKFAAACSSRPSYSSSVITTLALTLVITLTLMIILASEAQQCSNSQSAVATCRIMIVARPIGCAGCIFRAAVVICVNGLGTVSGATDGGKERRTNVM